MGEIENMYQTEINKIKAAFDPEVYQLLQESDAILAGGAITSVFTNREVNDYDIYFKSKGGWCNVLREMYGQNSGNILDGMYSLRVVHYTGRSILCDSSEQKIQLIGFKTFNSVLNIFESFDFTINMAAFEFKTETLTLHKDFLKHNSQRFLSFNEKTDFPLVSALRVDKYKERGYSISKAQMFRLLLAVNNKQFNSWEDFKSELGGLYGLNPDEIVDETKEFSVEEGMRQLDKVFLPNKHYTLKANPEFTELFENFPHMVDETTKKWYDKEKESGGLYARYRDGAFDNSVFFNV